MGTRILRFLVVAAILLLSSYCCPALNTIYMVAANPPIIGR